MASAIPTSSLVLREAAAQPGVAESALLGPFNALPNELILNVFKFLSPEGVEAAARVNSQFRRFAEDESSLQKAALKFSFHLLKNIFDSRAWGQILKLETLELEGVSFEGAKPFNPVSASQALEDIHRLQVEGDAGYTVITMPKGLTINKLKSIIARFAAERKFPSAPWLVPPGFNHFSHCISKELGDVPVAESYTFAISNSVLQASRFKSYDAQRASVNAAGCELPQVLEAMTLLFLTYMASGERRERLCSDAPWTFMRCLEQTDKGPLAVGGFASKGLNVSADFDYSIDLGGYKGAGFVRNFSF